jgi:hypothetical protein
MINNERGEEAEGEVVEQRKLCPLGRFAAIIGE